MWYSKFMFTGIVEEIGIVKSLEFKANGAKIVIGCQKVIEDVKIGDSIAIDGVCQTVIAFNSSEFSAEISDETLKVTTLGNLKSVNTVNLERALTLSSRLGGHIVSGHVDCMGKFINIEKLSDFYNLQFEIPEEQEKYVVYKGSITINGVSLTVANIVDNIVSVAIIPHTYNNTSLKDLKLGQDVNIETDILGKYVEKFLSAKDNKKGISMNFLQENGFV